MFRLRYSLSFVFVVNLVAANVLPRDYSTLLRDFKLMRRDEPILTSKVNAFDGTSAKWSDVQLWYNAIDSDTKQTTTDFQNQASMTNNQCDSLLHGYGQPLEYDVQDTSKAYIAKKSTVVSSGYKAQVQTQLKTLQADYQTMMNAACVKCTYTSTDCPTLRTQFYNDWQNAINAYAT